MRGGFEEAVGEGCSILTFLLFYFSYFIQIGGLMVGWYGRREGIRGRMERETWYGGEGKGDNGIDGQIRGM